MKRNPSKQLLLLCSFSIFVLIALSACSKHNKTSESGINRPLTQMSNDDFPCIDIWSYTGSTFPWAVTWPCPISSVESWANEQDMKRQRRIDSIIKANALKYRSEIFTIGAVAPPCNVPFGNYTNIPLYGTSAVNNDINVLLASFTGGGQVTATIYVLQTGILGGGVFISLEQGTVVKTFGFYPNVAYNYPTTGCGVFERNNPANPTVTGEIRNNAEIPYSISISKVITGIQFQNLQMYLCNTGPAGGPNFYNYNLNTFNETHYALGVLHKIGITTTYQNMGSGANNFPNPNSPYQLAQNLKLLTPPAGTAINLDGGITPGVSDIIE